MLIHNNILPQGLNLSHCWDTLNFSGPKDYSSVEVILKALCVYESAIVLKKGHIYKMVYVKERFWMLLNGEMMPEELILFWRYSRLV